MSSVTETINIKDSDVTSGQCHEKVVNGNMDVLHEATTNVLRKKIQEIREDVLGHVNNRINDMMSEVLQKIEVPSVKNGEFLYNTDKYHDKRKSSKKDTLPVKEFIERNSLLTDLFEIPHIRTIYNLFIVTLILLFFHTIASDVMESGTVRVGTNTLRIGFAKFPTCIYIWSLMQVSTLGVYVAFTLWAYQRLQFLPKSPIRKFWDYGWLAILILYQVLFVVFPTKAVLDEDISIGCSFIVVLEQIRMMMKSYAFIRSSAPKFLSYKPHNETPRPTCPRFSQYLYFLFAPTLVYRDEYPRTKRIRWMVVIRNFIEVGLAIFYLAFIFEHFVAPIYVTFGTRHLEQKWFFKNIIEASLPGILYFITGQYLLLHAWLNAWAEMLQFADRLFYKDWWNCTNYHSWYRSWNVVVHDWLYTYIYKDIYEIVMPRNRKLSAIAVFLVSAIFHEYVLAFAFRFFYPVMFILFGGIGLAMFFVRKITMSNVFMWLSWCLGNGIMFTNGNTDVLHEEIREDILEHVNNCINDMSEVLQKIEVPSEKNGEFLYNTDKYHDKRKSGEKDTLPVKEFIERNSLLTDLFEIPHIRTIYNLFMVTFILLFFHTIASDVMESGTVRVGTNTLRIGFAKFPTCIYIWSLMQVSTLGIYVAFSLWAYRRLQFLPKSSIKKFWDYGWLAILILYQVLFVVFPTKAVLDEDISIGCSFIIVFEQIRMMMKSYAFIRSSAPKFLSYKPHNETPQPTCPRFSQYLYFLFAPTLVYRDEYPRTKRIRWMVVIRNFIEVGLAIFYLTFIFEYFIAPTYGTFGTQHLEQMWFFKNIIEASFPGSFYTVTIQYLVLHAWLNAWAEMLQFADRLFYKDWWNCTNYHSWYRSWNVVVHDWLYTYIYKDICG